MASFINKLKHDAFDALDINDYDLDLQGWMDPQLKDVFQNAISGKDTNELLTIVEVGTWKGLSTTTMAGICKELGFKNVDIIAIDTWLGAPEFWTWGINDPSRYGSLKCTNGYPSVFSTFTKNVKKLGHEDFIAPFPISSTQGADVLKYYNIQADVIYVDAAHEYEPVLADIKSFFPLLKPGGTMIGDDYVHVWAGVMKAVQEYTSTNDLNFDVNGIVWNIKK